MTSLRSDEAASMSEIERARKRDETLSKGVKLVGNVASVAGGAAALTAGAKLGSKILPFLSDFIPQDLAMKGINKISPQLGKFLKKGQSMGLNVKEGFEYLRNQFTPKKQEQKPTNIIEEHSPELHEFIVDKIGTGITPMAAAFQATQDPKFKSVIESLQKKAKKGFSEIIGSIFGGQDQSKAALQPQPQKPVAQQTQPQAQQQAQQPGPGQQALMGILQQLQKTRGG